MTQIKKRILGKTGIAVSEIGFGLWAAGGDMWGPTDDQDILDTIDLALENGVNFYDTADVYGMGHSEELLGKAMKGRRDEFVVATKIGWIDFDEERFCTAYDTVDKLVAGVESNMKRLDTDYIDVIQSHIDRPDPTTDVFIEGFQKLQREGKIRAYGVSTGHLEQIEKFNADAGLGALQIDYSILNRLPEAGCLPYCEEKNIGVIVRGALAMGILAGKFTKEATFSENDFRRRWLDVPEENEVFLQDLANVEKLKVLTNGRTLAQLALQFTLANPTISTVIPGVKNQRQLQANMTAGLLAPLTAAEMSQISAIIEPGGGRMIWPASSTL